MNVCSVKGIWTWLGMGKVSGWILPVLAAGVFLGCGSGTSGTSLPDSVFQGPTPVVLDGDGFYVDEDNRLVVPTITPVPTLTPRPTSSVLPRLGEIPTPTPTSLPTVLAVLSDIPEGEVISCVDYYRRMLVDYGGRVSFGPEVAGRLSEEMRSARSDCVAGGWNPEFGLRPICVNAVVGGVRLKDGFLRYEGAKQKRPVVLSSRKDGGGNLLLHFERLPLEERSGCWYYLASRLSWFWAAFDASGSVESGVDRPVFPRCEAYLKELLAGVEPSRVSALFVARMLDLVKLELSSECAAGLWESYPRSEEREDCEVLGTTGVLGDGSLLINWHPDYPASDGAVCWVRPSDGDWRPSYPVSKRDAEISSDIVVDAGVSPVDPAVAPGNLNLDPVDGSGNISGVDVPTPGLDFPGEGEVDSSEIEVLAPGPGLVGEGGAGFPVGSEGGG